jgi:GntR family transcriptional regulator
LAAPARAAVTQVNLFTLVSVNLRHDSAVPIYRQLAGLLRERIASGALAPGAPMPSESSLMGEYGISRDTVRKAMDVLREEGLAVTVQGKGSYVATSLGRQG